MFWRPVLLCLLNCITELNVFLTVLHELSIH